jgi:hypothetical protein
MAMRDIFEVFSRRSSQTEKQEPDRPLTHTFRTRLVMYCAERFGADVSTVLGAVPDFWEEVHGKIRYLVGRTELVKHTKIVSQFQDIADFLMVCPDENVLDFIEYIFQTHAAFRLQEAEIIHDINQFFRVEDLPYEVTPSVWAEKEPSPRRFPPGGSHVLVTRPQVIRRDDEVTHEWAVGPALTLLRDKSFTSANTEFLKALADFRKGDYDDCLTKCGSAFESTMKIICDRKGWPYDQRDTADPLIRKMLDHSTNLEGFFHQPLLIIGTIRNRLSSSHGSGVNTRNIPAHVAKYAINATAAAILLLVEESGL